ncbi:MAG: hypothetical protein L0Z50_15390, partial [Verrucomicrobiales bacterium]|nr:hypothetical protein [Verrucomicrobiales bacterium]
MTTTTIAPNAKSRTRSATPKVGRAGKRSAESQAPPGSATKFIKWFSGVTVDDIPLVGGKNASLGEMYRELSAQGVKVPNGFAITAEAYRHFLREAKLDEKLRGLLEDLDTGDLENLRQRGSQIRHAILAAELPRDLALE